MIIRPSTLVGSPLIPRAPTTQETAVVMCGGGDPFAEYEQAKELCAKAGRNVTIFAGNDMIEKFPEHVEHACTLHPDKLQLWMPRRKAAGYGDPSHVWAHRNYQSSVTEWTRDWQGSTGLFCVKVARENGFTHIVLCGVHMSSDSGHFVRQQPWMAVTAFMRGWVARMQEIRPYVRSFGGWTKEQLGEPTEDWLRQDIIDQHTGKR